MELAYARNRFKFSIEMLTSRNKLKEFTVTFAHFVVTIAPFSLLSLAAEQIYKNINAMVAILRMSAKKKTLSKLPSNIEFGDVV